MCIWSRRVSKEVQHVFLIGRTRYAFSLVGPFGILTDVADSDVVRMVLVFAVVRICGACSYNSWELDTLSGGLS